MAISVTTAAHSDAAELAVVAAATFPLACPSTASAEDVAAFLATRLSERCFAEYLTDPDRVILTAVTDNRIIGYAMLIRGLGDDPDIGNAVQPRPAVELSKMYVLPAHHGTGAAAGLIESGIAWAAADGARAVWLGVNMNNARAQRFYRKHGFRIVGARTFRLGDSDENDFVMARPV